jgi:hypothetical protein
MAIEGQPIASAATLAETGSRVPGKMRGSGEERRCRIAVEAAIAKPGEASQRIAEAEAVPDRIVEVVPHRIAQADQIAEAIGSGISGHPTDRVPEEPVLSEVVAEEPRVLTAPGAHPALEDPAGEEDHVVAAAEGADKTS